MTRSQIAHRYEHHPPKGDQAMRYEMIRAVIRQAALTILELTPQSPEQAAAFDYLDNAMMVSNAAIARHEVWSDAPQLVSVTGSQNVRDREGEDANQPQRAFDKAEDSMRARDQREQLEAKLGRLHPAETPGRRFNGGGEGPAMSGAGTAGPLTAATPAPRTRYC